jgi:hypothetical protein
MRSNSDPRRSWVSYQKSLWSPGTTLINSAATLSLPFPYRKTIMFNHSARALLALNAFFCLMSSASADNAQQLSIKPVPGKETCASLPASTHPLNPELCVAQGNFSNDVYVLKLDGHVVLKGIDDQTTVGIASKYKNQTLQLRCAPQNILPKESPEATLKEVQRLLPNATAEEATQLVELLGPGPMGVELGRLCTASSDGNTLLTAQVLFK